MSETAVAFARWYSCGVETVIAFVGAGRVSTETVIAFAGAGRASTETAIAFAGAKCVFLAHFSGAEVSSVSVVPCWGRAVVMVVSMVAFRGAQWCCRFQSPHGRGPVREKVRPAWSDGGREREIVRPAHEKWPKIAVLWRAGRDYSRKRRWKGCVGRVFSRSSNRGIPRDELCCAVALVVGPSTGSVNPSMRCYTLLVAWWAACPRNHLSG